MTYPTQRGFAYLPAIFIAIALVAAVGVGYVLVKQPFAEETNTNATTNVVVTNTNTAVDSNTNTSVNTNTSINPTADWKTYTNAHYGAAGESYTIKYPKDWLVRDFDPQYVRIDPPNSENVNRETASPSMSIDFIVVPGTIAIKTISDPKNVIVGGMNGKQGIIEGVPHLFATQVEVNGGVLQFYWSKVNEFESTLKEILNTVIFTSPTADWKTYTNADYKYQIKHPESYVVSGSSQQIKLEKGKLGKSDVHSVRIHVLAPWNLSLFSEEVQSWHAWAVNGFKTQTTFSNKRMKKLGDTTFTVFDFDQASGSSDNDGYFYVTGNVVYLLVDERLSDKATTTNETIISTFKTTGTITNPTAEWKTYTNTTYHYSVKYPKDWDVSALSADCPATIKPKLAEHTVIGFIQGNEARECIGPGSAGTFVVKSGAIDLGNGVRGTIKSKTTSTIIVGGTSATKVQGTYAPSEDPSGTLAFTSVTLKKGATYFLVNYHGDQTGSDQEAFDLFLSTLSFTE